MTRKAEHTTTPSRREPPAPEVLIGLIVRERRKALGLRQIDIEGDEGLDQTYISKLEKGIFQPCLRALIHLEKVLQLSPGDLFKELNLRMKDHK